MLMPLVPNLSEDGAPIGHGNIDRFTVSAFDAVLPNAFHFRPRNELGELPCTGQVHSIASHIQVPFFVQRYSGLNFNLSGLQEALPERGGKWFFSWRRLGPKDPFHPLCHGCADDGRAKL